MDEDRARAEQQAAEDLEAYVDALLADRAPDLPPGLGRAEIMARVLAGELAWIIHENIYRNGLAADGGFRRPQNPLWLPKSVLEPIQRPKRMNMQLNVAELIRQKCS